MVKKSFAGAALGLIFATNSISLADVFINFDVDANNNAINAPAIFDSASVLKSTFATLGVHFAGPTSTTGGAILNDSTYTHAALSGNNFLAFSAVAGEYVSPETITFDTTMSNVSIYASCFSHPMSMTMQAYNASNTLLDTNTINLTGGAFSPLSVSSSADIKYVVLSSSNAGLNAYSFDNLLATTLPEPASMMLFGMTGTLLLRRRSLNA